MLNQFLRIFLLQFIVYTVIGVIGAVCFNSFELTAVCLLAPIQVLANQLSFMMMVEDVKFKKRDLLYRAHYQHRHHHSGVLYDG